MVFNEYLPSQNTLFEVACNALQAGSIYPFPPPNTSFVENLKNYVATTGTLKIVGILLLVTILCGLIFRPICIVAPKKLSELLNRRFPSLKYRKAGLIGCCIYGGSFIGLAVCCMQFLQGISLWSAPVFLITTWIAYIFQLSSRLVDLPDSKLHLAINFVLSSILVLIANHFFPQQIFHTCTTESLNATLYYHLVTGLYLAMAITSFIEFQLILNAEKLYIKWSASGRKYTGYIQKKGSEWVEILTEDV